MIEDESVKVRSEMKGASEEATFRFPQVLKYRRSSRKELLLFFC
jgi:hypothetical protein